MRLGINLPGPFWVSFRVSPSGRRCLAGGVMHRNARTASRCRDCQDITWDRGIAKQERRDRRKERHAKAYARPLVGTALIRRLFQDRKHAAPEITLTIEPGPKSAEVMREWRS